MDDYCQESVNCELEVSIESEITEELDKEDDEDNLTVEQLGIAMGLAEEFAVDNENHDMRDEKDSEIKVNIQNSKQDSHIRREGSFETYVDDITHGRRKIGDH